MISRRSETPGSVERTGAAPRADTSGVLGEAGVGPDELERLRREGIV